MGILYYYSQVLVDVNDSQNYPIKTIIAGLVPTLVTTIGALVLRNTLKAYKSVLNDKYESQESIMEEMAPDLGPTATAGQNEIQRQSEEEHGDGLLAHKEDIILRRIKQNKKAQKDGDDEEMLL